MSNLFHNINLKYVFTTRALCVIIFTILTSVSRLSLADDKIILPQKRIDLGLNVQDKIGEIKQIFHLHIDNNFNKILNMYYRLYQSLSDPTTIIWMQGAPYHITFDLFDEKVIDNVEISVDELDSMVTGKDRWDNRIELEDSRNTIGKLFIDYKQVDYTSQNLIISPNKKTVGGTVQYHAFHYDGHFVNDYYFNLPRLWNAIDGKILYKAEYNEDLSKALVIETKFSSDSRFYYARYAIEFEVDLIDTTNFTTIPAEGDIAYTSDVRYMVTGRNGKTTLVDLTTMEEIQKYEIQGYMTACAFSPDNKELYIVDSYRKLYIFDARLPTRIVGWELYE
ncbi:MAG: hypothetical protein AB1656_05345 [Candidatus Omnitrophota bacterium]